MIRAAQLMPKTKFFVYGAGHEGQYLLENAPKNMKLCGLIKHKKMAKILSSGKILFFPSKHDCCPNTTIEAMACKTPVVGYKEGAGIVCVQNKTGFIVKNVEEAVKKMELLLTDQKLWQAQSNYARKYSQGFSWEKAATIYEKALKEAIKISAKHHN